MRYVVLLDVDIAKAVSSVIQSIFMNSSMNWFRRSMP